MSASTAAEIVVGVMVFITFMWLAFFFDWERGGKIVPKSNFGEQMDAMKKVGDTVRKWVHNEEDV